MICCFSVYTLTGTLYFFTPQVGSWKPVSGKNENAVSSWQSKEPKWLGAFEEMVKCHNPGMIGSSTVPMRTLTVTTVLVSGVIFFFCLTQYLNNASSIVSFSICPKPLFQGEVKYEAIDMKIILYFHMKLLHLASSV